MTTSSTSATTPRTTTPEPHDVARQWTVLVSAVVAVAVSFLGSGAVVGTPVNQVADGALSSSATLVAPAGPAFAIWGVIYTGLILLALLQVLPARRADARQRRTGWWTTASLLLNAAWILVIQVEQIVAAFVVIAALAAVLVVAMVRLGERPAATAYERIVVDGTLGLYLGWVCIATVANGAAALVVLGVDPIGAAAVVMAVLVLVVAGAIGVVLAVGLGGRIAPALSLAWGLAWVAVARTTGEPTSTAVATTAALAAVVTLASAVAVAARRRARR
jgi:MFS family permease